ncbi:MAG TPA: glycosyltransferase, partial [Abditibacteriaceae bacterium]
MKLDRNVLKRVYVLFGGLWLTAYFVFRFQYINMTPALAVFSVILFLAELHTILHLYGMFYSLWPRKYELYEEPNLDRNLRCNLFVCVCGEPPEVVRETIKSAMEAARFYNESINPIHSARVVVLNDGKVARKENWYQIQEICEELGVQHVARDIPGGFKAGNINNGLKQTPTDDPHNTLDIIFDSDFCAKPEFLVEIVKPFSDSTVDFAQSPQRYKNEETWVAKAAAAHQIFFFDHICPAKGYDNALFLCGTNFAIRRSALDAVDGIDTRYITEDYSTSLNLHLKGRKGVFIPRVLALGMAPTSLKQYFTQQKRWSKGNFDVTRQY